MFDRATLSRPVFIFAAVYAPFTGSFAVAEVGRCSVHFYFVEHRSPWTKRDALSVSFIEPIKTGGRAKFGPFCSRSGAVTPVVCYKTFYWKRGNSDAGAGSILQLFSISPEHNSCGAKNIFVPGRCVLRGQIGKRMFVLPFRMRSVDP